ncbi:sporulation protein Cse60 [Sutcliffiella rhizosphaerae]|uniref:Sporulation protein cse60 n=1 Tax=Sutcliffiella rhizosphaerae TaxID=2880967 RepID=A0ABM8YQ71_9BACI|nr:sporulation protein Cse60 [Sutcliffiella rhizosphaerae]CAG9622156.1 Sporulation protein cse60 [Sutcliffiella rhizosphaerae]
MVQVRLFDEEHERDLEDAVNHFLKDISERDLIDIKYQVGCINNEEEQIYCFSAMVIFRT